MGTRRIVNGIEGTDLDLAEIAEAQALAKEVFALVSTSRGPAIAGMAIMIAWEANHAASGSKLGVWDALRAAIDEMDRVDTRS